MSDINIEDFIHGARTFQDEYNDLGYFEASDRQLADFIDEALTLARSYDKLLRELDVANARQVAPYWPVSYPAVDTIPAPIPDWGWRVASTPVAGTVWEVSGAETPAAKDY